MLGILIVVFCCGNLFEEDVNENTTFVYLNHKGLVVYLVSPINLARSRGKPSVRLSLFPPHQSLIRWRMFQQHLL